MSTTSLSKTCSEPLNLSAISDKQKESQKTAQVVELRICGPMRNDCLACRHHFSLSKRKGSRRTSRESLGEFLRQKLYSLATFLRTGIFDAYIWDERKRCAACRSGVVHHSTDAYLRWWSRVESSVSCCLASSSHPVSAQESHGVRANLEGISLSLFMMAICGRTHESRLEPQMPLITAFIINSAYNDPMLAILASPIPCL